MVRRLLGRAAALALFWAGVGFLTGCQTVKVTTVPPDARVRVDGKDLSESGTFDESPGRGSHKVQARKRGHKQATVTVERNRMHPVLKWTAAVFSLGLATVSSLAACGVGLVLCNLGLPAGICGGIAGGALGLASPDSAVLGTAVSASQAPHACTIPGMALCGLLGSWPLLGMLIPVLFPISPSHVEVVLEPRNGPAPAPAAAPDAPAPAKEEPPIPALEDDDT